MIVDFHTHILPKMDDGSLSVEMSLGMLCGEEADVFIATPHFYAQRERLESFLSRRKSAWERLIEAKEEEKRVALGAEVAYFPGIGQAEGLGRLCIQGTDVLLLELPYMPWTDAVLTETEALCRRYTVVLAHIERYLDFRPNLSLLKKLRALPVYMQVNAGSLRKPLKRFRIGKHIGDVFLLGSDMHNLESRPPELAEGREKLSREQLAEADGLSEKLLQGAVIR